MKLFSRIMSKKGEPQEAGAKLDLDMDVEPLRRRDDPVADDTGDVNPSKLGARAETPPFADPSKPVHSRDEEPEEVAGAGWADGGWDEDDWDDDEDWGDEDLEDETPAPAVRGENAHLVEDIRGAVDAVQHVRPDPERKPSKPRSVPRSVRPNWAQDEEFGRRAIARSQLGGGDAEAEDRILRETNSMMTDRETSRRRSAMAHLKAAAAATKADRVLQHVASRDAAGDPEEQSPYRDDLAKVVRPRSTSRPISRPVSRPRTEPAPWDQGTSDDDAAMFAAASEDGLMSNDFDALAAEEEAARAERLARAPAALSEEDFADDDDFYSAGASGAGDVADMDDDFEDDDDVAAPSSASGAGSWASRWSDDAAAENNAFSAGLEDEADEEFDDEDEVVAAMSVDADDEDATATDGPVPSRVVSQVVAFANSPEDSGSEVDDALVRRQIAEVAAHQPEPQAPAASEAIVNVGAAVTGRAGRSAGRVKTRLLGFQAPDDAPQDVFETAKTASADNKTQFPVGWIIVIAGPGRGTCYTMFNGVSQIGRGEDQAVRLDFGDTSISRNNHAAVAFDDEQGKFFLGHGGKSNLVRLNGKPVLSTEELSSGDEIRIGETTLKFVALCGETFTWTADDREGADA